MSRARVPASELLTRPTLEIAGGLLGWRLVREEPDGSRRVGRIVELEAYIGEADQASHARFGRTARNEVMYGPPGRAYVYLVYGMHDCLNITTGSVGAPAALLVRAVEPLEGIERMRAAIARRRSERRRGASVTSRPVGPARPVPAARLAAGPGLVCAAFGIDRSLTGQDLFDRATSVHLEPPPVDEPPPILVSGPRVGIAYAGEPWTSMPWRVALAGNPAVSRPAVGRPAPRAEVPSPAGNARPGPRSA